jgi:hypothetical protein
MVIWRSGGEMKQPFDPDDLKPVDLAPLTFFIGFVGIGILGIVLMIATLMNARGSGESGWAIAASILLGSGLIALAIWKRR